MYVVQCDVCERVLLLLHTQLIHENLENKMADDLTSSSSQAS